MALKLGQGAGVGAVADEVCVLAGQVQMPFPEEISGGGFTNPPTSRSSTS